MVIRDVDFYKKTHWRQYPPDTQRIYSYLEARGGRFPSTAIFGNRYQMEKFSGVQFSLADVDHAEKHVRYQSGRSGLFNRAGWLSLLERHSGKLPLKMMMPEEGSVIGIKNVLLTIENTDYDFHWLTNYIETPAMRLWYPYTVASVSLYCRNIILKYLNQTGTPEEIWNRLTDFGSRGVSSEESAKIGGAAHLAIFKSSDTVTAIDFLFDHYGATFEDYPSIGTVANEHSTTTTWGKHREKEAYANMLEQYPTGVISVVSDSWKIINAVDQIWGVELKDAVMQRKGTVVIRPDSGEIIPTLISIFRILGKRFGFTMNQKGYQMLPFQLRVIQADGITVDTIEPILEALTQEGWSADNLYFGMGGGLLQKVDRDTMMMAMKCSESLICNITSDVYKEAEGKVSKRGRLALIQDSAGVYSTVRVDDSSDLPGNKLVTGFLNGQSLLKPSIYDIRRKICIDSPCE